MGVGTIDLRNGINILDGRGNTIISRTPTQIRALGISTTLIETAIHTLLELQGVSTTVGEVVRVHVISRNPLNMAVGRFANISSTNPVPANWWVNLGQL